MKPGRLLLLFVSLSLLFFFAAGSALAAEPSADAPINLEGMEAANVDALLAKMSDEQVRALLVAELDKDLKSQAAANTVGKPGGLVYKSAGWLHLLDVDTGSDENAGKGIFTTIIKVPADYLAVAKTLGNGSFGHLIINLILMTLVFAVAALAEFAVRRFTANFSKQFQEKAIPELDGAMRFIAGLMRAIPSLIHIIVFAAAATVVFILLPLHEQAPSCSLFLAILFPVVFIRLVNQCSRIICAPNMPSLRVLSVDDGVARTLHRSVLLLCSYTFISIILLGLLLNLNLAKPSFSATMILLATGLIILIIAMILRSRKYVQNRILEKSEQNLTRNWITEQFAQFWHVPAIFYFVVVWLIMINRELSDFRPENSSFLLSLLVLPLYIVFNNVGQWVVKVSVKTLRIYNPDDEEEAQDDEELQAKLKRAKERERTFRVNGSRLVHVGVMATLTIWVLSLWGYPIPYASTIIQAAFESLVAMAIGLITWRFASSYIEEKIAEATPEEEETEDNDDEFGSASQRGRSYTLLPMLRKFIASVLLVMVALVVFSALGVDIGPMLAGAGVVGLAIGFGAQKLVSDVFSGFFYLLDDAFRVGEYIQAGSVSGAVESITLRNVMLRHHRGMLQIVPHSELGSITNFMRGGLVIKFNLEFPYDTDIDKVRKIIKKVGIAMLKDEEFGKDFIRPVKSQGVRQITDSVMVIRVKFTAHPGTQFVIQREAFRRITEALVAKGIHYAHRKVIVELPENTSEKSPEEQLRLAEAGAAAGLARIKEDEKKKAEQQDGNSSGDGLMGM
jgi:small-conductance mechanosensitive channel